MDRLDEDANVDSRFVDESLSDVVVLGTSLAPKVAGTVISMYQ